ncbi:four helix bundle protein [Microcoleus sp. N3A4]|uniref:four helix bundle protein n=1 Tax=Microcoleus sp. N3A4 TaxID=3055379 RepID=UPI002FCF4674
MDEQEFKQRTKQLALRVIKLVSSLPKNTVSEVIGKQLIRSGTSVGANYRAACRARSTADLIAKLRIVEEEADESLYWMELIVEAKLVDVANLRSIIAVLRKMRYVVGLQPYTFKWLYNLSVIPHLFEKGYMSETNEILAMRVASIKTLIAKNPTANRK